MRHRHVGVGTLFDIECCDSKTRDGAFLAMAPVGGAREVSKLPKLLCCFSFYGSPTDMDGPYWYLEVSFSNLSQSTNAEISRMALVSVMIP